MSTSSAWKAAKKASTTAMSPEEESEGMGEWFVAPARGDQAQYPLRAMSRASRSISCFAWTTSAAQVWSRRRITRTSA